MPETFQLLRLFDKSAGAVALSYLCLRSKRILITYNYLLPIFVNYLSALGEIFVHILSNATSDGILDEHTDSER